MNKNTRLFLIFILISAIYFMHYYSEQIINFRTESKYSSEVVPTTKIASWNMQVYGVTKASDDELVQSYVDKLSSYDLIFLQEIRDKSNTSFWKLCTLMDGYSCELTDRAGRSSSKEQYGILYKSEIQLVSIEDYTGTKYEQYWERPPVKTEFNISGYILLIYNIHTKPDEVSLELENLENLITLENQTGNVMIIGDLNADCSYYSEFDDFVAWHWLIDQDTTVAKTDCAYDRIIVTGDAKAEVSSYGVDSSITSRQSDHYLIWVQIGE